MLAWMLYVIMVTLLLSVGAYVAERAAHLARRQAMDLAHRHPGIARHSYRHRLGDSATPEYS